MTSPEKQNLLLLHGAIGSSNQLRPLAQRLDENFQVHTLNFSGHGGVEMPNEFSIELFSQDVITWIEKQNIPAIAIFGYSMGGYVALYLAKHHPEKIGKIFTLGTKFNWTPEIAQQEVKMLNAQKITEKIPAFAETLAKRHAPHDWKTVLEKTACMMLNMGNKNPLTEEDLKVIEHKVLLSVGDCDNMVSLEETARVKRALQNACLLVLPNTAHPIEHVNLDVLAFHLVHFFSR